MNSEELYNKLFTLIEESEARMEKASSMVNLLASTCAKNMEVYDKHLTSLENSRNIAQENASKSIALAENMTNILAELRKDYQAQLQALKSELHSLKNEYRNEQQEMRLDYKELAASYRRLAERVTVGGSTAEVNIKN